MKQDCPVCNAALPFWKKALGGRVSCPECQSRLVQSPSHFWRVMWLIAFVIAFVWIIIFRVNPTATLVIFFVVVSVQNGFLAKFDRLAVKPTPPAGYSKADTELP